MTASSPQKSRMVWLDCLRLIAGVSMVGLHASSDVNGQPFTDFEPIERAGPVLFRAVIYMARTELFIIISLFLLAMSLDRRPRGYFATVIEQAKRLLLPFAFWVVFYAFYRLIKASYFGYSDAILVQLGSGWHWLSYFILGSVQYHMHFLPTLFGLVLLFPLYRMAVNAPWIGVIVLLCLFAKRETDIALYTHLSGSDGFGYLVRGVKILTYAGYGVIAASFYGLLKKSLGVEDWRALGTLAGFVILLLFMIKLVYSYKVILAGNWQYAYDPAYWADYLMPVALFALFMSLKDIRWPSAIGRVAPYSFGIYLVHPIFLDLLEIALWGRQMSPSVFVFIKVMLAISLTSIAVFHLARSPKFAWTIGMGPFPRLHFLRALGAYQP